MTTSSFSTTTKTTTTMSACNCKNSFNSNQGHRVSIIVIFFLSLIIGLSQAITPQYFEISPNKNLTVARGSSITIPCKVRNRQGECLWIHDGKGIGIIRGKYEFRRTPDNGDCGLTIYDVSLDSDNGDWQCQVTAATINQQTLQSVIIRLLVLISPERPTIRRTHSYTPDLQVLVDQENMIECSVANGNPAPKISWLLNGRNITHYSRTEVGQNPSTMAWSAISKLVGYRVNRQENRSNLTCYSEHPTLNQADSVILNVLYRPIVNVTRNHYSVMEGVELRIECNVDANPKATISWKRVGRSAPVPIFSRSEPHVLYFDRASRELDGSEFECQAYNDYGTSEPVSVRLNVLCEYFCEATNQINTIDYVVRSSNILLDVYGSPAFLTKNPLPTEGRRGGQSEVSLWFCADPPPNNVYCRFGSLQLNALRNMKGDANATIPPRFSVKPITRLGSKRGLETASNCYDSTLLIKDTDISDERDYVLVIENEKGSQEGVVRLRVVTPLSPTSVIAIALSILILVVLISIVTLLMVRKKQKETDTIHDHEEAKEDAQALSTSSDKLSKSGGGRVQPTEQLEQKGGVGGVGNNGMHSKNGGGHDLVYAHLEFEKDNQLPSSVISNTPQHNNTMNINFKQSSGKVPPPTKPKPQITQRQNHPRNVANNTSSTEYAQIAFSNRTEL